MTTPSANSKDDKQDEKSSELQAEIDSFLSKCRPLTDWERKMTEEFFWSHFKTVDDSNQIQQLKQEVDTWEGRYKALDRLTMNRIMELAQEAESLESQLLQANKRIEELEKQNQDFVTEASKWFLWMPYKD